jgi:hypothetical protein
LTDVVGGTDDPPPVEALVLLEELHATARRPRRAANATGPNTRVRRGVLTVIRFLQEVGSRTRNIRSGGPDHATRHDLTDGR